MAIEAAWPPTILAALPDGVRLRLLQLPPSLASTAEEIRLRAGRPLQVLARGEEQIAVPAVSPREIAETVQRMGRWSVYALEEEFRQGFLTLKGGHRVGLAGRAILEGGRMRGLKELSGLNIRLAREQVGIGTALLPDLRDPDSGTLRSTLILSPPGAGKTTLLRDLVRLASDGEPMAGLRGVKVGLVDERSEVAAVDGGQPQLRVGLRTDVLDGCPKAEGMMLLLRSLSPALLACDELGRAQDAQALQEARLGGVRVLATAHAAGWDDFSRRASLAEAAGIFERVVVLSRRRGPGTIEAVLDGQGRPQSGPC